jgi:DNA invertase Pin-like site-specific DNA recombinase
MGWQRERRNTGISPGHASRFSEEEIREMRSMFLTHTVAEIAEHFNCARSLIYKWQRRDPIRYRTV